VLRSDAMFSEEPEYHLVSECKVETL